MTTQKSAASLGWRRRQCLAVGFDYEPMLVRLHKRAIPEWAMPIAEGRAVIALHGKAVPEAPRLSRLRCRNADEEGNRRKGAENELHRVFSSCRYAKENDTMP